MRVKIFVCMAIIWVLTAAAPYVLAQSWECISRENVDIYSTFITSEAGETIYAGTKNKVIKSQDRGESWRQVLNVGGSLGSINLITKGSDDLVYAATGKGLFCSVNQGKNWRRIFKGRNYLENNCNVVLIHNGTTYLGTSKGIFISKDNGRSWDKKLGEFDDSSIISISPDKKLKNCIYVASTRGVFKTLDSGLNWHKIFTGKIDETNSSEEVVENLENKSYSYIKYMAVDDNYAGILYLASSTGIYKSEDAGQSWQKIPEHGLLDKNFSFLIVSADSLLYAATKTGVYEFRDERWYELSFGLTAVDIRSLALDAQNNLYVCCEKGLFRTKFKLETQENSSNNFEMFSKDAPDIEDVQKAAIKYGEVEPEKILLWRKQAAAKALLPKLSASVNRDTGDIWHWESGSSTKAFDDALMKGNDAVGWDVSVSWDLSELIWNSDQTSIDSRSKLLVELRGDIIDEVTKIYFERIRVKMELNSLQIEDRKRRFDKELKLKELTAMLDGYTGGYFSKGSKKNKS